MFLFYSVCNINDRSAEGSWFLQVLFVNQISHMQILRKSVLNKPILNTLVLKVMKHL